MPQFLFLRSSQIKSQRLLNCCAFSSKMCCTKKSHSVGCCCANYDASVQLAQCAPQNVSLFIANREEMHYVIHNAIGGDIPTSPGDGTVQYKDTALVYYNVLANPCCRRRLLWGCLHWPVDLA